MRWHRFACLFDCRLDLVTCAGPVWSWPGCQFRQTYVHKPRGMLRLIRRSGRRGFAADCVPAGLCAYAPGGRPGQDGQPRVHRPHRLPRQGCQARGPHRAVPGLRRVRAGAAGHLGCLAVPVSPASIVSAQEGFPRYQVDCMWPLPVCLLLPYGVLLACWRCQLPRSYRLSSLGRAAGASAVQQLRRHQCSRHRKGMHC